MSNANTVAQPLECTHAAAAQGGEVVHVGTGVVCAYTAESELSVKSLTRHSVNFDLSLNETIIIARKEESTWGSWLGNVPPSIVSAQAEQEALAMIDSLTECIMQSLSEDEDSDSSDDDGSCPNDENSLNDLLDSIVCLPTFVIDPASVSPPLTNKRKECAASSISTAGCSTIRNKKRRFAASAPLSDITSKFSATPTSPQSVCLVERDFSMSALAPIAAR